MDWTAHTEATAIFQQHLNREVERLRKMDGVDDITIRAQMRVLVERALRSEGRRPRSLAHI